MSSLLVFNRVYRLEIQSGMLFSTSLVNYSPLLTFSPLHPPPFPPPLPSVGYVFIQYVTGGRGNCLRQINTCRQVPWLVNFKEKPTFRVWCLYRYLVHVLKFLHYCAKSCAVLSVSITVLSVRSLATANE